MSDGSSDVSPSADTPHTADAEAALRALAEVKARIARICREENRDPASVTLVAVSKTHGAERIAPLLDAGHRVFGENRVQEAKAKWPALIEAAGAGAGVELHLIGPLQSNKAADAVALFDAIHTLDRESLAAALAKEFGRLPPERARPRLLVQVNTGEEPQKAGIAPAKTDAFLARCREVHGLHVEGLMCIPPLEEPAAGHFALLAQIARRNGLKLLSMGMSADMDVAVRLGATHVRVGSAIFGEREGPAKPPGAKA